MSPAPPAILALALAATLSAPAALRADEEVTKTEAFLLIDDELGTQRIDLTLVDEHGVHFLDPDDFGDDRSPTTTPLTQALAVVREDAGRIPDPQSFILLSDGQRLPGTVIRGVGVSETAVPWKHPRLGRIDVPLEQVRSVVLGDARVRPEAGQSDVVVLNNGDRLGGFIMGFGDVVPIMVDLEGRSSTIDVPLARVVAATLVTPPRAAEGRRLWLEDGTILDVGSVIVKADERIEAIPVLTGRSIGPSPLASGSLMALLLHPDRVVELAAIAPTTVDSRVPRYVVPEPRVLDASAPLGLTRLEYQGPVVVRYALPPGTTRFAAEAILPASSRIWGDFELLIRDDDEIVHRRRLNARHPTEQINVALSGSELTIELTQGAHGPIHDRLHLECALLLVGGE